MIEALLPPAVVAEEEFGDAAGVVLFAAEEEVIAGAVEKRRAEFITVRGCARRALARLGHPPRPLLPGPRGAPGWPPGIVGSMTHCAGYRGAAAARVAVIATLGIDAEPREPLPDGVLDLVARSEERARLVALREADPSVPWDRVLFSAKEAVYKAWYPLTEMWLDFQEASLEIDAAGTFTVRLLKPGLRLGGTPADRLAGRWLATPKHVATAVAVAVAA